MINQKVKRIIIGISGGIAAYKTIELVRRLRQANYDVIVVMTEGAKQFVTPLSLQAVSGERVRDELFDLAAESAMGHIELARWADLIVIAPASADIMASIAHGRAHDLLTTLCLATTAPLALALAMNQQMWQAPATVSNLAILQQRGLHIWGPANGDQACGEVGPGRMLEAQDLFDHIQFFQPQALLADCKVMITLGPTREAIDPVRYISNRSSGKMGLALAHAVRALGGEPLLIAGPVSINLPDYFNTIKVTSAQQMYDAVFDNIAHCHIFIGAAAVADYRPAQIAKTKIASQQQSLDLSLLTNADIIAGVGRLQQRPFCVGFAAQTDDLLAKAQAKLQAKNLDVIIANDVSQTHIGFDSDDNEVYVLSANNQEKITQLPKTQLAQVLLERICNLYRTNKDETCKQYN